MRLYLSSFRLGAEPEHLLRLAGAGARTAVIANAIDAEDPELRREKVDAEVRALRRLGLDAAELDLRPLFGAGPDEAGAALAEFDALWLRGGNVFVLRTALAVSGADRAIRALIAADRVVYAGYSAGPCVLAPSLAGLETVDDSTASHAAYGLGPRMDGLAVLPFLVVPHCGSPEHPESAALDRLAEQYRRERVAHVRLRDGEALVVDGEQQHVVGRPVATEELLYERST